MQHDDVNKDGASSRVTFWLAMAMITAVGGFLRFWRLGDLGLVVDEGFQVLAVRGILEHGWPQLDSGLVYTRSFIFLYIQALCNAVFGLSEFAMRLPAAVFGVATIPLAYWFGRSLMGVRAGWLMAVLFALSAWEIEYARYARFYTMLQVLYMVGLVAWFRGFIEMKVRWRWAFLGVFLLTITTHPLGVMLGMSFLFIIPLRGYSAARKWAYFFASGACGAFWVLFNKAYWAITAAISTPLVEPGGPDVSAEVAEPQGGLLSKLLTAIPAVKLPELEFIEMAWGVAAWGIVAAIVVLVIISVCIVWLSAKSYADTGDDRKQVKASRWSEPARVILLLLIAWTALFYALALALTLSAIYLACYVRSWKQLLRGEVLLAGATSVVGVAAWMAWLKLGGHGSLTDGARGVLSFPALWDYWFQWMLPGWPVMLLLMVIGFVVLARRAVTPDDRMSSSWFILAATLVPLVVTAQLEWEFAESRYFLHLYPLMLLWVVVLVVAAGDGLKRVVPSLGRPVPMAVVTVVMGIALIFALQDTDPRKAWAVADREYGQYKDPIRSVINFKWHADFHQDVKTASEEVRSEIGDDDVVVVVGPPHMATVYLHYAGRVDYILSPLSPFLSVGMDAQDQVVDLVTGGTLVTSAKRLEEIRAQTRGTLWLLSDWPLVAEDCWFLSVADPELKTLAQQWMQEPYKTAQDYRTTISRLPGGLMTDGEGVEPAQ